VANQRAVNQAIQNNGKRQQTPELQWAQAALENMQDMLQKHTLFTRHDPSGLAAQGTAGADSKHELIAAVGAGPIQNT
jgi:hypothetical protein